MTTVNNNEKISFVLYGSYEEQLNMLTDEQVGILLRNIYSYVRTGEKHADDPMVTMLLSVICHQLDIDARKYEESKLRRQEAGKKGGRPRKNTVDEKAMVFSEKRTKDMEPVDVDEDEDVYDDVDEYVDVDVYADDDDDDDQDLFYDIVGRRRPDLVDDTIFPYGDNDVPTTLMELDKFAALANKLLLKHMGRTATTFDIQRVFDYVYTPAYTEDNTAYATYDDTKAELLAFVFDRAAEQNRVTWKYIGGIWDNYQKRGVTNVEDAIENEYAWNRGEAV